MTPEKNAAESKSVSRDNRVDALNLREIPAWTEKDMLRAVWRLADCEVLRLFANVAPEAGIKTYH